MNNYQEIFPLAFETLSDLGEARQDWVGAVVALVGAKKELVLANAIVRRRVTLEAGGAKALGANTELREQALTVALAISDYYGKAEASYNVAFEHEARAKQDMLTLNDTLTLFETILDTDAFADPVERFRIRK